VAHRGRCGVDFGRWLADWLTDRVKEKVKRTSGSVAGVNQRQRGQRDHRGYGAWRHEVLILIMSAERGCATSVVAQYRSSFSFSALSVVCSNASFAFTGTPRVQGHAPVVHPDRRIFWRKLCHALVMARCLDQPRQMMLIAICALD
jgi:hypothetical protein